MISLKLALRFLNPTQKDSIFSSLSFITLLGVLIGVMTLILTCSVFIGFERKLKSLILESYPHVILERNFVGNNKKHLKRLEKVFKESGEVEAVTPFLSYQGLLSNKGRVKGVQINGVDWKSFLQVVPFKKFIQGEEIHELKSNEIILGSELQKFLNVTSGEKINFVFVTPNGQQEVIPLVVKSFFHVGRYEQDLKFGYVDLKWLLQMIQKVPVSLRHKQALFEPTAFGVRIKNPEKVESFLDTIQEKLLFSYSAQTWMDVDRNFIASIGIERRLMFLILTIIIIVASFNIISLLIVIAKRRTREISILLAIGARRQLLFKVFLWIGFFICVLGIGGGVVSSMILSFILRNFQIIHLPADIYQLSRLPIVIEPSFVLSVCVIALVLCFLSILFPSLKMMKVKIVEGIQYE